MKHSPQRVTECKTDIIHTSCQEITSLGKPEDDNLHRQVAKLDKQLLFLGKHQHRDQNQGHEHHHEYQHGHLLQEGDHEEEEARHRVTSNRG